MNTLEKNFSFMESMEDRRVKQEGSRGKNSGKCTAPWEILVARIRCRMGADSSRTIRTIETNQNPLIRTGS